MPSTRELTRLFEAIADDSRDASVVIARAIADEEQKKGHLIAAKKLRSALQGTGNGKPVERLTATIGRTPFLTKVLFHPPEIIEFADVQLRKSLCAQLEQFVLEFKTAVT